MSRRILAGVALSLLATVVVLVVTDPFAGTANPGGVTDNATSVSLATVTRRPLSSQTQVSGTLGYAGSAIIRQPGGASPAAVKQASESVTDAREMLRTSEASLSADGEALAGHQAMVSAARQKESVDCAGDNAAESATGASPSAENSSGGVPSGASAGASPCASDIQAVSSAEAPLGAELAKVAGDRASLTSAAKRLDATEAALTAARSSGAAYGPSSTFTRLPSLGHVVVRGQALYEVSGQPALLLYGSVPASRAFVVGMPAGPEVAELNANLEALGFGHELTGDAFTAATATAIGAFQSKRGLSVTGELLLGAVVFEPGAVRVTGVTPAIGQSVMPGPVLTVTSTVRQIKVALDATEQSSVQVGDPVAITLPTNQTTPGIVSSVGTVASAPASKSGEEPGKGEEGSATIEAEIRPTEPDTMGRLDQAPVTVAVTSESVPSALALPVNALLALAGGGYAVEEVKGRVHHLVAVTLGLFDDAEGLVQVSGRELRSGQRVVVPTG